MSQRPAIRHARHRGFRVVAVDGDPNAIAFADVDVAVAGDFSDVDLLVDVGRREAVDGLLAISTDRAVVPAATAANRLGLPGIDVDVATAMTDKWAMRLSLAAAGIPQPRFNVVSSKGDVGAAGVPYPAVLKPVDSGGQRGVFLVRSSREAHRRLPEVLALSRSKRAMLEEFVDGTELNGIVVVRGGTPVVVTLSDRLRPGGRGFGVGWIHSFPSALTANALADVRSVAAEAVCSLGLRDGIGFPQLISTPGGVRVVEVAARIPAGQMADLVRFATGVNLFDVAFAQALGDPVPDAAVIPAASQPVAIRFLTARPGPLPVGTVERIAGLHDVRMSPGVFAADLYFEVGETIRPVQVDADRRGYVIATGPTAAAALGNADRAAGCLEVTVRRDRGWLPHRETVSRHRLVGAGVALLGAAAVAVAITVLVGAGTSRALLQTAGARIVRLSPLCRCPDDVAHISFRLLRAARVDVVVARSGERVATLLHDRLLAPGWQRLTWHGQGSDGRRVAAGSYRAEVVFDALHHIQTLPDPILVASSGAGTLQR